MRIIFMGNPDFAVPSLQRIHEAGFDIVAVITGPDKPAGRGLKIQYSPVKEYALEHHLKILQPEKLKDEKFLEELKELKPDLGVVIAFRMLPDLVWSLPKLGTINLHASLLPQYRGAAPINWAIINDEKETGLTTFFLKHEIDTGNIIFSKKIRIGDEENAGSLHDRMMEEGASLILETLNAILSKNYPESPQPQPEQIKFAPKIYKKDCQLDFFQDVNTLFNKIRGLSPYPTAFTYLGDKVFKIFSASTEKTDHNLSCGTFIRENKSLKIAGANGFIFPLEVQLEGKKKMRIGEFLNGYGDLIEN